MNKVSRCGRRLLAMLCLALLPLHGFGAVIQYTSTLVGGNHWIYDFRVTASAGEPIINEFTLYFDPIRYANLSIAGAPSGSDPLVIAPDPAIPADGFFDALATGEGIAPGASLAGFQVAFDFVGNGTPGSQRFDIVDPTTFATLFTGTTTPTAAEVPEPASGALLVLGLALALISRRRHR